MNISQLNKNIGQNIVTKQIRYDLEIISDMIDLGSKVLDIGCGDGELLYFLKNTKNIDVRGIEISQELVTKAIKKSIPVIQGDGEKDLEFYPNHNFDYAILSQTIQATQNPKKMLEEMLRIARFAIISLPNFANFKNRFQLLTLGKMPVNKNLPFLWYNTPNIHFCSIKDFENLCNELDFQINKKIFLTTKSKSLKILNYDIAPNLLADFGIFMISKNELCLTPQEQYVTNKAINSSIFGINKPIASNNKRLDR